MNFWIMGLCLSVLFIIPLKSQAQRSEWSMVSDEDGIKVSKKEIPDSPLIAFKGEGLIHAPISKVAQVILDTKRNPEWMDSVEDAIPLKRQGELEFIDYTHIGMPFLVKDREFVTLTKLEIDKKNRSLFFKITSIEHPLAPKTDFVRAQILDSSFLLKSVEDGKQTFVSGEMLTDPKGSIPKWVVNFFQSGWPRKTIKSLRLQVMKPDITSSSYIEKVFSEATFVGKVK